MQQPDAGDNLGKVLRVPFVKYHLRSLLELLLLLLYALVLLIGPTSSSTLAPTVMESLLYLWGWALILDEYYQYRTASHSLAEHFGSLWNRIDLLKLSAMGIASAIHVFAIPINVTYPGYGYQVLAWSRMVLALGALPAFTRIFAAISLDQKYGVLFLSCARMFDDIKRFMVLLGIVMLAFGLTFSGLASANLLFVSYDAHLFDLAHVQGPAPTCATFDESLPSFPQAGRRPGVFDGFDKLWNNKGRPSDTLAQAEGASKAGSEPMNEDPGDVSELDPTKQPMTNTFRGLQLAFWALHGEMIGHEVDTMPRTATILLWVYFMLSQVVLLNLLVAIMGDTWQQIRENADDEWKYLKVNAIAEYFELHHIPPPFNACRLLRALVDGSFGENIEEPRKRCTHKHSAADVSKLSKDAQSDLLKAWRQEADLERASQLRALQAGQQKMAERMDILATQVAAVLSSRHAVGAAYMN
ncbi:hypothetical protein AB1Y20_017767 [Prymnesium parvum]|uniref:Ion transport domain-containing protein n=1 Tax=Prymnesium parvum TaxID=97485 RepID=A0AB34JQC5_PRYPA